MLYFDINTMGIISTEKNYMYTILLFSNLNYLSEILVPFVSLLRILRKKFLMDLKIGLNFQPLIYWLNIDLKKSIMQVDKHFKYYQNKQKIDILWRLVLKSHPMRYLHNAMLNEQIYCNGTTMLSYTYFIYILGPSFTTIAAFGSNGAIIHYTPTQDTDAKINSSGLFLGISKFERLIHVGLPYPKV